MAAPVFVSGSVNSAAITTGTSATVTSTGTTPVFGNLQIVFLAVGGASRPTAFTPPAGWNTLLTTTATAGTTPLISVAVFWRTAPATAAFSGSFTWTTTATSGEWLFTEWSGQGPLAIDGAVVTSVNATSTSPTSPTITPANGRLNDTLVCALAAGATGATTITIPAGMSSVLAHAGASGTQLFGCASLGLASASATGTKTWTLGTTTLTFGISFLIQQGGPFVQGYASEILAERPLPRPPTSVDFQARNLPILNALTLGNQPVGSEVVGSHRAVVPPQNLDFAFPNLALPFSPPVDLTKIFRPPLISRQAPVIRQLDFAFPNFVVQLSPPGRPVGSQQLDQAPRKFWPADYQFPNVALQAFAQLAVKPVGGTIDESVPIVQPRQLDFQFRNVALEAFAQLAVKPVGAAIDETVPSPQARQLDFAFPNVANPPTTPVALNVIFRPPLFNRPVVAVLPVDVPIPNLLTTTLTTPVVKPIIPQPFSDRPTPQPRQLDFAFPNVAGFVAKVKPFSNQFFDRPVATQIPIDAPIPNLLTTTLFVAPTKPIFNPIFERAPVPTLPQDNVPPNLLVTILSTPVGIPFLPNIFLMTDRPSPQAPSQDQCPVNLTINLPPPTPPVGLHQNPFFITMGRLAQLGNLPS